MKTRLRVRLLLARKTLRLTRRLHNESPHHGWRWALDNAMLVQRLTLALASAPCELSEAARFEADVLTDIALLPEVAA